MLRDRVRLILILSVTSDMSSKCHAKVLLCMTDVPRLGCECSYDLHINLHRASGSIVIGTFHKSMKCDDDFKAD